MEKTAVDNAAGRAAALDVYDFKGGMLVKAGAVFKAGSVERLKKEEIPFVYTAGGDISVNAIYNASTTAEMLKVLWNFMKTGGEKADILKCYSIDQVKQFISYSRESSAKLAYGHVLGFFAAVMLKEIKNSVEKYYDFYDYRSRESYNNYHAVNTACLCGIIGANMGLSDGEVIDLITGAALIDIKMGLYEFVNENRGLNALEKEEMSGHAMAGFEAIRGIYGIPSRAAAIILRHHERFNGGGYPKGLKNSDITIPARIAAVADVYDSMTSRRPFRAPFYPDEAWEHISKNSGVLFDPDVVSEFKRTVPKYSPGDRVVLASGKNAVVISNAYGCPETPEIVIEKNGQSAIISFGEEAKNYVVKTILSMR
jgi:HD-GYP domain-containing protein (c-di-GMP phosphodiesterase class II)